jgi:hypothetical protein
MGQRLQLHNLLRGILGSDSVYFQPPNNIQMQYPCIVYQRDDAETAYADNNTYRLVTRYQVTVIDRNPDSLVPSKVAELPMCTFNRYFAANNLNHDVYNLYF